MRRPNHSLASQVNLWKPRELSGISLGTVSLTISDIKDTQCQRPFVVVRDTEVLVECFEYMRIPTTDSIAVRCQHQSCGKKAATNMFVRSASTQSVRSQ